MSSHPHAESEHRPLAQNEGNSLAAPARIAENKTQISDLERSLRLLKTENGLLQAQLDASTYPVLTLPNEIVCEIFVHFLPVYPETPPIIGRSSPALLGQICRKWREIALGTPRLWRAIGFSLENGKRISQKLRLLELWLQRSGSCLLSIDVHLGERTTREEIGPFLVALAAHCLRWEHLRSRSSTHCPLVEIPPLSLRTLYIASLNLTRERDKLLVSFLSTAPLLQTIAVYSWPEQVILICPWSQLTTLIGLYISPRQCVDVLDHASNLVYCKMHVYQGHDSPPSSVKLVTLPYLSTFILRGLITRDAAWNFLDFFTLPALQTLEVSEHILRDPTVANLQSLISRSRCTIQELYITHFWTSEDLYRLALPTVGSFSFGRRLREVYPFTTTLPPEEDDEETSDDGALIFNDALPVVDPFLARQDETSEAEDGPDDDHSDA